MSLPILAIVLLVLALGGYYLGRARSVAAVSGDIQHLHSLPSYYGSYVAIWCGVPAFILFAGWLIIQPIVANSLIISSLPKEMQALPLQERGLVLNDIKNMAAGDVVRDQGDPDIAAAAERYRQINSTGDWALVGVALALAVAGLTIGQRMVVPQLRARNVVERVVMIALIVCSLIAILTTVGIVLSLLFESIRFFGKVPLMDFLFGIEWSPQTALRADQVGSTGVFGAVPLFAGTMLITLLAMLVAVPVGLMSAVYLSDYAPVAVRSAVKPALEILAGVPTVVYGFFAAITVAPMIRNFGESVGLSVASESALAAGLVMGIMIIPFVSSLSDDVINAVPQTLRDGSYAMGATKSETIKRVVLPAALPGIVGSVLLAVSRAIGETMIVVMAAGLAANLTANPFEAVTTVTVQIVTLLVGDQEFDSAKTLAAFALGLMLFLITLCLNVIALRVVDKYREKYD